MSLVGDKISDAIATKNAAHADKHAELIRVAVEQRAASQAAAPTPLPTGGAAATTPEDKTA